MNESSSKIKKKKIIATTGFHFSGSGLINDILIDSGCVAPKNIRADELFYNVNSFSWPRALNNEYTLGKRTVAIFKIIKILAFRIPFNILQKTILYERYLNYKGRGEILHRSTSVNRNIWSYLLSLYLLVFKRSYDEYLFSRWFQLKYKKELKGDSNMLLDKAVPNDKKIAEWFFKHHVSLGIAVYRDPRIQYQQIKEYYKLVGLDEPNYYDFLIQLETKYESLNSALNSNVKFIPVSFDKLIGDKEYRKKLEDFFHCNDIVKSIIYDFNKTIHNNEALHLLSKKISPNTLSLNKEKGIYKKHILFEKTFNEIVSKTYNEPSKNKSLFSSSNFK